MITEIRQADDRHMIQDATTHCGLWLDRCLKDTDDEMAKRYKEILPKDQLLTVAEKLPIPDTYSLAYKRWAEFFQDQEHFTMIQVEAKGRLAAGLGAASILETSLRLHHTYGVPVLPGSALKGVASHYCLDRYGKKNETDEGDVAWSPSTLTTKQRKEHPDRGFTYFDHLFGHQDFAGGIIFHDAWFVPDSVKEPLMRDVTTVHHPNYYGGKMNEDDVLPPADWDDPIPIPFVTVRPHSRFLVVLEGDPAWLNLAVQLLLGALEENGIGAKTSSGYGRMKKYEPEQVTETVEDDPVQEAANEPAGPPDLSGLDDNGIWKALQSVKTDADGSVDVIYTHGIAPQNDPVLRGRAAAAFMFKRGKKFRQWQNDAERSKWAMNLERWAKEVK